MMRTQLFTGGAVRAGLAGYVAALAPPARGALTPSALRVTGRVVGAGTLLAALHTVLPSLALSLAADT